MWQGQIYNRWKQLCMGNAVLFCQQLIPADDAKRLLHLINAQYNYRTRNGSDRAEKDYSRLLEQLTTRVNTALQPLGLWVVENHIIRPAGDGIGWHQDGYTDRDDYTLVVYLNVVSPKDMTKFAVQNTLRSGRGFAQSDRSQFEFIWDVKDETRHNCIRPPGCVQPGCAVMFRGLVFHGVDPGPTHRWVMQVRKSSKLVPVGHGV